MRVYPSKRHLVALLVLAALWPVGCGDDGTPPKADRGVSDQNVPKTDQGRDLAPPDLATPDLPTSDRGGPDGGLPDTANPDQAQSCTACHGTPPASGKHTLHSGLGQKCSGCHAEVVDDAMQIVAPVLHKNGMKNVKGGFTWDPTTRKCSNVVGCHVDRIWPQ